MSACDDPTECRNDACECSYVGDVTPEQRDAWAALAKAATPGPWGWGGSGVGTDYWDGKDERPIAKTDWTGERGLTRVEMDANRDNGRFIAAARTAVPALLAENAELRATLEAAEVRFDEQKSWGLRERAEKYRLCDGITLLAESLRDEAGEQQGARATMLRNVAHRLDDLLNPTEGATP